VAASFAIVALAFCTFFMTFGSAGTTPPPNSLGSGALTCVPASETAGALASSADAARERLAARANQLENDFLMMFDLPGNRRRVQHDAHPDRRHRIVAPACAAHARRIDRTQSRAAQVD